MQRNPEDRPNQQTQTDQDPLPPPPAEDLGETRLLDTETSRGAAVRRGASAEFPPESRIGTSIGRYEIVEVLGQGGMGTVLRARDPMIERDVAVKLLSEELSGEETAIQRFLVEARSAGKLNHPNTVAIHEIGQHEQNYYLVMEFVEGGSIEAAQQQRGAFSVLEASRITADACKGLAAAHGVGLVHRDIKPANLLLSEDGTVKVADFGLAKIKAIGAPTLTSPNQVMGTPYFMSPEQCEFRPVDARSDIYSLGATYYSLLTGQNPYAERDSLVQVMYAHCQADVPDPRDVDPAIPEACSAIIARAMAKAPGDRYQTAAEMLADLEVLTTGQTEPRQPLLSEREAPSPAVSTAVGSVGSGPSHRKRWLLGAGGAIGLACLVAMAVFLARKPDDVAPEPVTSEKMPPVATAQGVTGTTITLGTTTAYSGPSRDLGQNMVLGMRACFSAINDAGGIHGRRLELVVLDDGYEPDRALANMKELLGKREVFAVIGNVGTPTAKVTVPYALEHRCLFFAPFTGASLLRLDPPDRYVFNYRASYADETAAMVEYFVEVKGIPAEQIAVFAQNDAYGDDGFAGVVRALRKYEIREEDVLRVNYDRNTTQVAEAVEQFEKQRDRFKAIVMVPTYVVAARFIQQLRARGLQPQFGIVSFVGSNLLAQEFRANGLEHGEGVVVTQVVPHFQSHATTVIRYRELLAKYFPEARPGFVSLEGFIAAECLVEGLKRAGSNLTTESLVDALEAIRDLDLGIGPIISFGPSRHQASSKVWGTRLNAAGDFETLDLK